MRKKFNRNPRSSTAILGTRPLLHISDPRPFVFHINTETIYNNKLYSNNT